MKMSIRFWQTALFITVTVVAALVLYVEFLPSIKESLGSVVLSELESSLNDFENNIQKDFPVTKSEIDNEAELFSDDHQIDIWIFNSEGKEIYSRQLLTQPGSLLEKVLHRGLQKKEYKSADLEKNLILVSKPVTKGKKLLGVVIATNTGASANIALKDAKDKLLIALFVAVFAAAALGFIFSEVIARQVYQLKEGALAIAKGNFDLRLKKRLVPDDIAELAQTFNLMAEKLTDAFNSLRSQQEQILTVVNSMSEGVIEVSVDGMINLANPAAANLLDYPVEKLIGSQLEELIHEPNLLKCIKRALSGQESRGNCEYNKRFLLLHSAPVKMPESHSGSADKGGVVLILQDFTEQKKLDQAQRNFVSNASHELRTPIASLKGFIELLEDGAKNKAEVRDNFLLTMQGEVDRLQRLVDDLLVLTQLDSGINILHLAEHHIDEIIKEVAAIGSPLAASVKINLRPNMQSGEAVVICDKDRVIQVLLGFIDNALKYTPEGGEITIFSQMADHSILVGVRDTGSGIPSDKTDKIFQRFYRDSIGKEKAKSKGSGLGLAIASEIVKAHGGRIKVSSKLNQGSTFSFKLKLVEH